MNYQEKLETYSDEEWCRENQPSGFVVSLFVLLVAPVLFVGFVFLVKWLVGLFFGSGS